MQEQTLCHYAGAVPNFIDADSKHFGMCPQSLFERLETIAERRDGGIYNRETGRRIAAVVPMHADCPGQTFQPYTRWPSGLLTSPAQLG